MNKFQEWALKRKPSKETVMVSKEVDLEELTPEEELELAWEDWKYEFRTPLKVLKASLIGFSFIIILWALAVVDIQNKCYLDKYCRSYIKGAYERD